MTESTISSSQPESSDRLNRSDSAPIPDSGHSAAALAAMSLAEKPPKRDGFLFNIGYPLLLLAGAGLIFWLLGDVQSPERPPADNTREGRLRELTPVRVKPLQTLESFGQPLYLTVDGTVVPFREAKVAAEVAGRIVFKSDSCEAGSYVKKDEVLMRIDRTDHELEVQRLTNMRDQEYQALRELEQEMANTKRLIEVASDDVEIQQREVKRLTSLPQGFASGQEIDQANRSLLSATQQLVTVENQLQLQVKSRVRLEATQRLAATQLQAAELSLERTEIRAPIDGVIVTEDSDLNTFVARGNVLLTIEDTSRVEVATSLRMDQLYWVLNQADAEADESSRGYDLPETPARIEYELSGRDGLVYRWRGRLLSYDGIGLDPITRTVPVRVLVDDPNQFIDAEGQVKKTNGATALVRGMFVRVKLMITPQTPLIVIPANAIQPGNRVMQFVPDETVLDRDDSSQDGDTPTQGNAAPKSEKRSSASPAVAELEAPFYADDWQPGRVVLRKSVYPVDSLTVESTSAGEPPSDSDASRRLWVCEVRDVSLSDDSFVVVSPLGSVDVVNLSFRAERKGMEPSTPANTNPPVNTTTAVIMDGEDS